MKNKKAEQIAAKRKHREGIKKKNRSLEPNLDRRAPELSENPSILIVCEGEKTEPSYFNQFRITSAKVKTLGEGFNTISLVSRAIELKKEGDYDQVWCVFDKDIFSSENFNTAIHMARNNNCKVAYSNQAFEYWLILHFDDHQGGGMQRKSYHRKINDLLKPFHVRYDKRKKVITEEIFDLLNQIDPKENRKRVDLAIMRAKRILYLSDRNNPASCESSTTVFELVEELLKYCES